MLPSASDTARLFVENIFKKYNLDGFGIQSYSQEFFAHTIKLLSKEQITVIFFVDLGSLHARLNSHYEPRSYKKRITKRLKNTGNLLRKNLQLKGVCSF